MKIPFASRLKAFLHTALVILVTAVIVPAARSADAPPPPSLPVTVYLTWQRDPVTTMTVHWHTDWTEGFASSVLEYRTAQGDPARPWQRATGHALPMAFTDRMIHTVEITGLQGDTMYEFRFGRIVTKDAELVFEPHDTPVHTFRTLPAKLSRPVRFISGGDIYGGNLEELSTDVCRVAAAQNPDFVLLGGDIAYVNGDPKAVGRWLTFFNIWQETMVAPDGRLIPVIPTIGNHEAHGDTYELRGGSPERGASPDRAILFYTSFSFPGRRGYNVLDAGDYLSVVALDSFHTNPVAGPQTDWLRETLAQRRHVPYVVPIYHVPAYPSHRPFTGRISAEVRTHWVPLFDEAGIRFAFENHDHAYKVSHPLRGGKIDPRGTRYLGDGAWGVNARQTFPAENAQYLVRTEGKNHVFFGTLHPDRADFVALDRTGEIFDRFSIPVRP